MKRFKKIDYVIQFTLIFLGVVGIVVDPIGSRAGGLFDHYFFFPTYFAVGGWQMISVIVHFFMPAHYKIKMRRVYLLMLLATLIFGAISLASGDLIIWFLGILLFWSPILAVIYLVTCIDETRALKKTTEQISY